MAEHRASHARFFEAGLQSSQVLAILGEERDGNAMHSAVLADFSRCLHVRKREYLPPSDLGNGTQPRRYAHRATNLYKQLPSGDSWRRWTAENLGDIHLVAKDCLQELYGSGGGMGRRGWK